MLLAEIALAVALVFGSNTPPPSTPSATLSQASSSRLPPTQPGLSQDEGVFLVTNGDDGGRAVYFIASNTRHSILWTDVQIELQLNPLWPVFNATPDQVQAFPEGAPIGVAHSGLVGGVPAAEAALVAPAPEPQPAPAPAAAADVATDATATADVPTDATATAEATTDDTATAEATDDTATADTAYIVQRGDSAIGIARRYGIAEAALLEANGISNPNRVYVGQVLTIPS